MPFMPAKNAPGGETHRRDVGVCHVDVDIEFHAGIPGGDFGVATAAMDLGVDASGRIRRRREIAVHDVDVDIAGASMNARDGIIGARLRHLDREVVYIDVDWLGRAVGLLAVDPLSRFRRVGAHRALSAPARFPRRERAGRPAPGQGPTGTRGAKGPGAPASSHPHWEEESPCASSRFSYLFMKHREPARRRHIPAAIRSQTEREVDLSRIVRIVRSEAARREPRAEREALPAPGHA